MDRIERGYATTKGKIVYPLVATSKYIDCSLCSVGYGCIWKACSNYRDSILSSSSISKYREFNKIIFVDFDGYNRIKDLDDKYDFSDLIGAKILDVVTEGLKDEVYLKLVTSKGILLFCFEFDINNNLVFLDDDDVHDLKKMVGEDILSFYKAGNVKELYDDSEDNFDSRTYTFFNIDTFNHSTCLRFAGESNGYYSEDMNLKLIYHEDDRSTEIFKEPKTLDEIASLDIFDSCIINGKEYIYMEVIDKPMEISPCDICDLNPRECGDIIDGDCLLCSHIDNGDFDDGVFVSDNYVEIKVLDPEGMKLDMGAFIKEIKELDYRNSTDECPKVLTIKTDVYDIDVIYENMDCDNIMPPVLDYIGDIIDTGEYNISFTNDTGVIEKEHIKYISSNIRFSKCGDIVGKIEIYNILPINSEYEPEGIKIILKTKGVM